MAAQHKIVLKRKTLKVGDPLLNIDLKDSETELDVNAATQVIFRNFVVSPNGFPHWGSVNQTGTYANVKAAIKAIANLSFDEPGIHELVLVSFEPGPAAPAPPAGTFTMFKESEFHVHQ